MLLTSLFRHLLHTHTHPRPRPPYLACSGDTLATLQSLWEPATNECACSQGWHEEAAVPPCHQAPGGGHTVPHTCLSWWPWDHTSVAPTPAVLVSLQGMCPQTALHSALRTRTPGSLPSSPAWVLSAPHSTWLSLYVAPPKKTWACGARLRLPFQSTV